MSAACETQPDGRHERWPHLPAAPWRYLGSRREVYQAVPGDPGCPIQPGGSCDHCGTGIYEHHRFEAVKTGERFKVGSTCVTKMLAEMKGDGVQSRSLSAAEREVRRQKNARARERRHEKTMALKAEARELMERLSPVLSSRPHPFPERAANGETLEDSMKFRRQWSGLPGIKSLIADLREIEASQ